MLATVVLSHRIAVAADVLTVVAEAQGEAQAGEARDQVVVVVAQEVEASVEALVVPEEP
jgi:hypothetical protein